MERISRKQIQKEEKMKAKLKFLKDNYEEEVLDYEKKKCQMVLSWIIE